MTDFLLVLLYDQPAMQAPDTEGKSGSPALKQPRQCGQGKRGGGKASQLFTATGQGSEFLEMTFYCTTIAYHVGLNALLVAARHHDQRLRKKDIYCWP